jgi:hypothetical protein
LFVTHVLDPGRLAAGSIALDCTWRAMADNGLQPDAIPQ